MKSSLILRSSLGAVIAGLSFAATTHAFAETNSRRVFTEEVFNPNARPHLKKTRSIKMERGLLQRPEITINIFGEDVIAIRDHVEMGEDDTVSWIGRISGSADDVVVLTERAGAFAGRIDYQGRLFEISRNRNGAMMISEIDASALLDEEPAYLPDGYGDANSQSTAAHKPATAEDEIRQDLLVAYTDDACRAVGGDGSGNCTQIEANIVNAVADINASYMASGVNITMNLVAMALTNYDESGKSGSQMLQELQSSGDGQADELHQARNDYGADLLALVSDSVGGFCGIGYVNSSASYAMSVTGVSCLSSRTLAHEIGHNQGVNHARSQEGGGVSGAYNYGYRRCNDGSVDDVGAPYFSTIMAYSCSGAARTGSFSNPNVNANGTPTGIDPAVDAGNAAWAARTINESAARIAGFRAATTTPPTPTPPTTTPPSAPSAPSALTAQAAGQSTINISWSDNSSNEDQFQVQRALGDGSFSTIAVLSANATGYMDNGLNAGTRYRYRVRASNGTGASAYSSVASSTTVDALAATTDLAASDITSKYGTIAGNYRSTHGDDGATQRITEVNARVYAFNNPYRAEHIWAFDIVGGAAVVFTTNAYVSGNEGFHLEYYRPSDRGWNRMLTVNSREQSNVQHYTFPAGTRGRLYIRAIDSYLGRGEAADTLSIDYMEAVSKPTLDQAVAAISPAPRPVVASPVVSGPVVAQPVITRPIVTRSVFHGRRIVYLPRRAILARRLRD